MVVPAEQCVQLLTQYVCCVAALGRFFVDESALIDFHGVQARYCDLDLHPILGFAAHHDLSM
jgi:hypothetical protein